MIRPYHDCAEEVVPDFRGYISNFSIIRGGT